MVEATKMIALVGAVGLFVMRAFGKTQLLSQVWKTYDAPCPALATSEPEGVGGRLGDGKGGKRSCGTVWELTRSRGEEVTLARHRY